MRKPFIQFVIFVFILSPCSFGKLSAADYTWTAGEPSRFWSRIANWNPLVTGPPGAADTAIFDGQGLGTIIIGDDGPLDTLRVTAGGYFLMGISEILSL